MDLWGFPKEWKWGYYLKNRDRHHNSSQAKLSSGGGRFVTKICATMGEVNQVAVDLVELQESTTILVLVVELSVVVALETQNNTEMVKMEH